MNSCDRRRPHMDAADVSQRLRQHGDDVQRLLAGLRAQGNPHVAPLLHGVLTAIHWEAQLGREQQEETPQQRKRKQEQEQEEEQQDEIQQHRKQQEQDQERSGSSKGTIRSGSESRNAAWGVTAVVLCLKRPPVAHLPSLETFLLEFMLGGEGRGQPALTP
ncbi:hypothetical protein QJQ45_021604, partial [Haematococcus lacustris]